MRNNEKEFQLSNHQLTDEELDLPRTVVGYPDFSARRIIEQDKKTEVLKKNIKTPNFKQK